MKSIFWNIPFAPAALLLGTAFAHAAAPGAEFLAGRNARVTSTGPAAFTLTSGSIALTTPTGGSATVTGGGDAVALEGGDALVTALPGGGLRIIATTGDLVVTVPGEAPVTLPAGGCAVFSPAGTTPRIATPFRINLTTLRQNSPLINRLPADRLAAIDAAALTQREALITGRLQRLGTLSREAWMNQADLQSAMVAAGAGWRAVYTDPILYPTTMGAVKTITGLYPTTMGAVGTIAVGLYPTTMGSTIINAGTLRLGSGGTSGSLTITDGPLRLNTLTMGSVTLAKTGAGAFTLSGANTYTGSSAIESGMNVTSGTLQLTAVGGETITGLSPTTMGLTKTGAGTLTLRGENTHNGSVAIEPGMTLGSGTLRINPGSTVGDGTVTLIPETTVPTSGDLIRTGDSDINTNAGMRWIYNLLQPGGTLKVGSTFTGTLPDMPAGTTVGQNADGTTSYTIPNTVTTPLPGAVPVETVPAVVAPVAP